MQYRELLNATACSDLQCLRSINSTILNKGAQAALINAYLNHPELIAFGDYWYAPATTSCEVDLRLTAFHRYGPSVDGSFVSKTQQFSHSI